MILEAANEGAQSLPSRILDAQRVNEESVTRSDLLTVSDSGSEDEIQTNSAEMKPTTKTSNTHSRANLPPPEADLLLARLAL
jgi:hypothetical protein